MPFGLTNGPATFERLMECVLVGLTTHECLIYLDDIIIFSTSFPDHLARLQGVLSRLCEAGLKLKPSKCHFTRKEVHYLGYVVSAIGIKPNPSKTAAVSSYSAPTNVKEFRQFLGLANYYRRFIKDYSCIAEPQHQLTRKTSKGFLWPPACQDTFDELKLRLTIAPILTYLDFSKEFILHTDASATALGAVLCQEKEGVEYVIGCEVGDGVGGDSGGCEVGDGVDGDSGGCEVSHGVDGDSGGCEVGDGVGGDSGGKLVDNGDGGVGVGGGRYQATDLKDSQTDLDTIHITIIALLSTFLGLGNIQSAQRGDEKLKAIIDKLAKGVTPTSTHPGLKKSLLEDGILCCKISLNGVEHTQIAIPSTQRRLC